MLSDSMMAQLLRKLGFKTLDDQRDETAFRECAIWELKEVLNRAFEIGQNLKGAEDAS